MQKTANDNFCMHCCNWQLLFALLLLTIFVCMLFSVCTIAIDTFLYAMLYTLITFIYTIANNHSFHMYYSHWKIVHKLLKVTTFVYTIAIDNFCMHCLKRQLCIHCNIWQPHLSTSSTIALHYYNCWFILIHNQLLVYTLLQLLTSLCITSNDNLCMHYCTWQLFYALLQLNVHALLQLRNPTSRRSETLIKTTWITL